LICADCDAISKGEYDQAIEQRDEINSMYHKIIKEVLECDQIPACQREDDQLEPPWEVIARIREQRDRLAEALWNMLNQEHGSAVKAGILLRSLNLQYLNPNTPNQDRKSPASDGSKFNNPNEL
jgi:hypothetical protein